MIQTGIIDQKMKKHVLLNMELKMVEVHYRLLKKVKILNIENMEIQLMLIMN